MMWAMSTEPVLAPYPAAEARPAFLAALEAFPGALTKLGAYELLAPSRCRGWAVADVAVHVLLGLQETLIGLATPTDADPTQDHVRYWADYQDDVPDAGVGHARFVRLLASAYADPRTALRRLEETAGAVARRSEATPDDTRLAFQDDVLPLGDFFATWTVELVIHHLDAIVSFPDAAPPPAEALALSRRSLDGLLGEPPPAHWDDVTYVLTASGRLPLGDADRAALGDRAKRFPLIR
jgi:hypothetical protein